MLHTSCRYLVVLLNMVKGQKMTWLKGHIMISDFGLWSADWGRHRAWRNNFEFRNWEPARRVGVRRTIANCEFKNKNAGVRIQNEKSKSKYLFSAGYWLLTTEFFVSFPDTRNLKPCPAIALQGWSLSHRVSVLQATRAIR